MRFLILALALAPALFGQSVEERLTKLEQEMRELRAENELLRKQLGVTQTATVQASAPAVAQEIKPAGKEAKLLVGGFIQAQAESGDRTDSRWGDENDRVFIRRARMNLAGSFREGFDFKAEIDLAGGLGSASGLRANATDVYAQWSKHRAAQIRAGQFKTPFGYEQLYSDTALLTIERSLASDRIAAGRGVGVQLAGDAGLVSYAVGAFNGNGINVTFNDDEGFLTAARVAATPWKRGTRDRFSIGVNGYRSEDASAPIAPELGFPGNAFAGTRRAWGVDSQVVAGKFELWAEVLRGRYNPNVGATRDLRGWYATGGWMLTPRVQVVGMVDDFEDLRTWTAGANYFIKGHDLKLQLNVARTDEERTRVSARLQTLF